MSTTSDICRKNSHNVGALVLPKRFQLEALNLHASATCCNPFNMSNVFMLFCNIHQGIMSFNLKASHAVSREKHDRTFSKESDQLF
jgi:hypothetical protein